MTGIVLDDNNRFRTRAGDFLILDTDAQDEKEILYANKGNFIFDPSLGVGIAKYSNSPVPKAELERLIRIEFEKDNINVVTVSVRQVDRDDFDIILETRRNNS